ncbi:MAG: hypothetical protein JKY65_02815 [Planctomycetes bacterium]|nr:hypothetical protein [Planctomycetota bacterium]
MKPRVALASLTLALALGGPSWGQEAPTGVETDRFDGYLVVTPQKLAKEIVPLLKHRRTPSRGHAPLRATVFFPPQVPAAERRQAIVDEVKRVKPRYLLLVGDIDQVPTFVVRKCATDRPYGDFDGDGYPEVAIGRFPTNDPTAIRRIVARTIRYETKLKPGAWQRQCALIAGEARFSPMIDRAIEGVFTRMIKETLPLGYDVDLTYANQNSPYCYPPERFADRVIERLNEGALVMAYIGHGNKRSVDRLTVAGAKGQPSKSYRVLDVSHLPRLRKGGPPPIVFAIACWNGNYDGARQSIGEEMLAAEGGPVAFFGASRISHPVHNGLLAKELIAEIFLPTRSPRLGPALDRARKALALGRPGKVDEIRDQVLALAQAFVGETVINEEMPRHVDMYNLFGDPALVVATPRRTLSIKGVVSAGRPNPDVLVTGRVRGLRGRVPVRITLETQRDKDARPTRPGETRLERYARANDKVLKTELCGTAEDGTFRVTFKLPADRPKGPLILKAFAQDKTSCAIGGVVLQVP